MTAFSIGALGALGWSTAASGQAATDRSVSASLMAVSMPSPAGPIWIPRDSALKASGTRYDVAWGRAGDGAAAGQETLVLGIRGEGVEHDRGVLGGVAGYGGARVGVRAANGLRVGSLSAIEFYGGVRSYGFTGRPYLPDVGVDLAVGWGGYGGADRARTSLGLRFPVEFVARAGGVRFTAFAAPTLAWGTIHVTECHTTGEDGENDCTFIFDQDLAFGRPRTIMSGGLSLAIEPLAFAVSAGVQHLSAPGEAGRFWVGLSISP